MTPQAGPAQLFDLGNALFARGDLQAAIDAFQACIATGPDNHAPWFNLGNTQVAAGRSVDAIDAFIACLRIAPDFGPGYLNLARTLRSLVRLDEAHAMAESAVRYLPHEPEAKLCLAAILHDRTDYAGAVKLYREVLSRQPRHAGALSSLGNSLRALGHVPQSLSAHDRAVAAAPDDHDCRFNRATALLAAGCYEQGFRDYDARRQCKFGTIRPLGPTWLGEDITGQTILLHAEQGLGDTLQFARYAPLVAARGARVILEVQPSLVRLMRTLSGMTDVIAKGDPLPPFQAHCPLLSLPLAFGTTLDTVPANNPYLSAEADTAATWGAKLPEDGRLRIGLVWAGGAHMDDPAGHRFDRRRSMALADFAPLAEVQGIHLISLQKDRRSDDAPRLPLIDLMPQVRDFADTAALVANLDLVIAVDTSVAHLAGALGRPVWLLNRHSGCWRWMHQRTDSPWYPGLRIYRQQRPLDWSDVIRRVRADLREAVVASETRIGAGVAA